MSADESYSRVFRDIFKEAGKEEHYRTMMGDSDISVWGRLLAEDQDEGGGT